jgi:type IV fimbrial biogenesis protein FimT
MRSISRPQGFTLLELMITLAVMAIALGMGVPTYQNMVARSQMSAAANDLIILVQNARGQAIRTRARVVVCPSTDGNSCGGSDWSQAISGVDENRDGTVDSSETVLRRASLGARIITSNKATLPLIFMPDGTARMGDASDDGIDDPDAIALCVDGHDDEARMIRVGFSSAQTGIVNAQGSTCQ